MRLLASFLVSVLFVSVINISGAPPARAEASGLELSELLIDPASPQSDAKDEFVELHNAYGADVQLSGFKLRVGSSSTLHALPVETIPADGYVVLTSAGSPWALTNAGGTITLVG